jgi:hypothetical protein
VKQYQCKLSPDFKRITARELPDFKERYLRDPKLDGPTGERYTLRSSREIVVSNAAELEYRESLLRVITGRLHAAKRKLRHTKAVKQRKQITYDIQRLQRMQTQLRQALGPVGFDHPQVRAAVHRALKTKRAWIKRELKRATQSDAALTRKERKALESELRCVEDLETTLFGVQHRVAKSFLEYGGKTPTADDIIHNAVIWRCLETGKPHLIWPKLTAIFPENYSEGLAYEMSVDRRVRQVTYRIKAGQIVGSYEDPIERLIAENYFESSKLPKPLCRLSRDEAVEQLEKHFQKRITVDKYRRHLKSLFLHKYS